VNINVEKLLERKKFVSILRRLYDCVYVFMYVCV